jgi:hypothetical protein
MRAWTFDEVFRPQTVSIASSSRPGGWNRQQAASAGNRELMGIQNTISLRLASAMVSQHFKSAGASRQRQNQLAYRP